MRKRLAGRACGDRSGRRNMAAWGWARSPTRWCRWKMVKACSERCRRTRGARHAAMMTIIEHGKENQKEKFLKPLLNGDQAHLLLDDGKGGGADATCMQTTAVKDGTRITSQRRRTCSRHRRASPKWRW